MKYLYIFVLVIAALAPSTAYLDPIEPQSSDEQAVSGSEIDRELREIIVKNWLSQSDSDTELDNHQGAVFELGKILFFSKALSQNKDVACASCHHPLLGGGDRLHLPIGVDAVDPDVVGPGRTHDGDRLKDPFTDGTHNVPRNSPTIFNLHLFKKKLFWDGRVEFVAYNGGEFVRTPDNVRKELSSRGNTDLVSFQSMFPIVSGNEMFGKNNDVILTNEDKRQLIENNVRMAASEHEYLYDLFQDAFNVSNARDIDLDMIGGALSAYQGSQIFLDSPWQRYVDGNNDALTPDQKKGALLFFKPFSKKGYGCASCHSGKNFSDENFYNIAIPSIGRGIDENGYDLGRMLETSHPEDKYAFRTPTLLNVTETFPYGHNGAFSSLEQIVVHHLDPETSVHSYDYKLTQLPQFNKVRNDFGRFQNISEDALEKAKSMSYWELLKRPFFANHDVNQIVDFLGSLTDPCITNRECLSRWLPDEELVNSDKNLLAAKFFTYEHQQATWKPPLVRESEDLPEPSHGWFVDYTSQSGLNYELPPMGNGDLQHLSSGGIAVEDVNDDGYFDLFVSHALHPGKLFINNRNGGFEDVTEEALGNLSSNQFSALFLDIDNDKDKDLLMIEDDYRDGYFRVYENLGGLAFRENQTKAGIRFSGFTHSLAAADFDRDGYLDLFATHWIYSRAHSSKGYLWKNEGDGTFSDQTATIPPVRKSRFIKNTGLTFTPIFSDIDNDGDQDLLVAADFETSQVLMNENGRFRDITTPDITDENGMGAAVGDIDNDGDFDWFVSSIWNPVDRKGYIGGQSGNRMYLNDGTGVFQDATKESGVRHGYWGWGSCMADFNNDGWLDVFHTNGMTSSSAANQSQFSQFVSDPSVLFINDQTGKFTEESFAAGLIHTGQGRGVSCFDYDQDGDIDVFISHTGKHPQLFKNLSREKAVDSDRNYLSVRLRFSSRNVDGVGSKIEIESEGAKQLREVRLGSNYMSNNPTEVHFGLGAKDSVNSLKVIWPDGTITLKNDVPVNRRIELTKEPGLTRGN